MVGRVGLRDVNGPGVVWSKHGQLCTKYMPWWSRTATDRRNHCNSFNEHHVVW